MRRSGISPSSLFFVLLALVAQLAFGAVVPNTELPLALHDAAIICHAPSPDQSKIPPGQHHRVPISAFCPLWTSLTAPTPLLVSGGPLLPIPNQTAFHRPGLPPPATAAPAVPFRLAQPRAPPVLA